MLPAKTRCSPRKHGAPREKHDAPRENTVHYPSLLFRVEKPRDLCVDSFLECGIILPCGKFMPLKEYDNVEETW
jgi:hypothetical protein